MYIYKITVILQSLYMSKISVEHDLHSPIHS